MLCHMFRRSNKEPRGVTLIEMAMVVLIIAIILGAVLAARAIIANARFEKFVRTIDEVRAAEATYQQRFGFWAGDDGSATTRWTDVPNGNNDGWLHSGEHWHVGPWQLERAGLLDRSMISTWSTDNNARMIKAGYGQHSHFYHSNRDWAANGTASYANLWRIHYVPADIARRIIMEKGNGRHNWNIGAVQTDRDPWTHNHVGVDISIE